MPQRPQQPELARSEHNQTVPQSWTERAEGEGRPGTKGRTGPVPEENRPGHQPERDQDKPPGPPGEPGDQEAPEDDPTREADQASPQDPGPGDSEGGSPPGQEEPTGS